MLALNIMIDPVEIQRYFQELHELVGASASQDHFPVTRCYDFPTITLKITSLLKT